MKTWRLIETGSNSGVFNMAIDEAIVKAVQAGKVPPTLRFYTWFPECISIGYFQKNDHLETDMNMDTNNRDIVRRITGGRAVLHGNDLSYSVVCHRDNWIFGSNIRETYQAIANAFIAGLKRLGITPDPVNIEHNSRLMRQKYQNSPLCFASTLGHEISINGKKLIGSAQRRWPDVFLQHGSVLLSPSKAGDRFASISLSEILILRGNDAHCTSDLKMITSAIAQGFQESLGITLIQGCLTPYELELSEKLTQEKYSREQWNSKHC